jgi:hypothetical protein
MSDFDKQYYFSLLATDPVAADDYLTAHQTGGMTKRQFAVEYATTARPAIQQTIQNAVNYAFAQEHPELLQVSPEADLENASKIASYIHENNLPAHDAESYAESLKTAFEATKPELRLGGGGETVRAVGDYGNVKRGQFVSKKDFLQTAPIEQVRAHFESQEQSRRR